MLLTNRALQRMHSDLLSGKPVPDKAYKALLSAFKWLSEFMHEHHLNEEEIAFPVLNERIALPPKVLVPNHVADFAAVSLGTLTWPWCRSPRTTRCWSLA